MYHYGMRRLGWAAVVLAGALAFDIEASGNARREQRSKEPSFVGVLDEHPAIEYASRPTDDRVSRLNRAIAEGTVSLTFQERGGYLRSILNALNAPAESQLLVFSKTGVQGAFTSPRNPRALFFDDSVVVGYVAGARFLELAAHDPEQGVVFYTLDQVASSKPQISRGKSCLSCHVSSSTLEVPGVINRSVFAAADGSVMPRLGSFIVTHRTPLLERWGGMYVTGNYTTPFYGRIEHMGNVTTAVHDASEAASSSNEVFIDWLNSAPETRGYPAPDSDIAALMVFDHQMHAINLLTRLNWESRVAVSEGHHDFRGGILRELTDELADYLLFVGEAPPPARLTPRAGFAERFTAAGPEDHRGRSLRELNLETRLLQYPCSYMIYAEAFDKLPPGAKNAVYQRLWEILSGKDARKKYAHLTADTRRAIIDILHETKGDLPDSFR